MHITVKKYENQDKPQWDSFVTKSENTTFLFYRDFMEYHKDRFDDFSLLFLDANKLVGILPANRKSVSIYSHSGLTFGGLILSNNLGVSDSENIFKELIRFLKEEKFEECIINIIPSFYQNNYSSTLDYLLFKYNATLIKRDLNFAINLERPLNIHKSKLKFENKGFWKGLDIEKTSDFSSFWDTVLIPGLQEKYNTTPVHSLKEITYLASKFPKNIKQYNVLLKGKVIAGITLFLNKKVVKSQYGITNEEGKKLRALDYLYIQLIRKYQSKGFSYFDMGTTNENNGYSYNKGLTKYKEEFSAKPLNQDQYLIKL